MKLFLCKFGVVDFKRGEADILHNSSYNYGLGGVGAVAAVL